MAMIGFNFTKIHAEKSSTVAKSIKVNHNILINNIKETPISDPKQSLLKFHFSFDYTYEPGIGKISLEGELTELLDKALVTKIMEEWTKNKRLPTDVMSKIVNIVYSRSNVEAILLSKEVNLPLPIKLPNLAITPKQATPAAESKAEKKKK